MEFRKTKCSHEGCDLPAIRGSAECVLHSPNPDKSASTFTDALAGLGSHEDYLDYSGITFPSAFPKDFFAERTIAGLSLEDSVLHCEFWLSNTTFAGPVNFFGAEFNAPVTITQTTFEEECNFGAGLDTLLLQNCVFIGEAYFAYLVAVKSAYFESSKFKAWADFTEMDAGDVAMFYDLTFCGETNFRGATFSTARFHKVRFEDNVSFRSCLVAQKMTLDDCHFGKALDFRSVEQRRDASLGFRSADFSNALLTGTDLRRIDLEDIKWREVETSRSRRRALVEECENVHFDGQVFEAGFYEFSKATVGQLELAYRQLKRVGDTSGDHELAGEFHIGEMEMKRRQVPWARVDRYPLEGYRLVSLYGERWLRPLLLVLSLALIVAVADMAFGVTIAGRGIHYGLTGAFAGWVVLADLGRCLVHAAQVVTLQRPTDVVFSDGSRAVAVFGSILGPILIAFLALALKERLKR